MIYVLIPAFNEADRLKVLLPQISSSIGGSPTRTIVVSDGSTDGTPDISAALGAEVIALTSNQGKSAALAAGHAALEGRQFECLVLMDGDGQHDPDFLPAVVEPVLAGEFDMVIGSRYLADPHRGSAPLNRYVVRRIASWYLARTLEQPITDPFSGYRCLSRAAFEAMELRGTGYQAELEMRFEAEIRGLAVSEVEVPRIYMPHFSKMGTRGGPLLGRLRVIGQYLGVLARKRSELASAVSEESDVTQSRGGAAGRVRGARRH